MSVAGFDIGNACSCVAVARKGGIDVLLNKESKRETPTVVSFSSKTRFLGTDAAPSLSVNPKNTVTQLKRLVGKQWSDAELQRDIASMPFKVMEGPDGKPRVEVMYLDKPASFSPEQLVAMMMVDQKTIAEKETGGPITDCVVSVPSFFTEAERYAMLTAAQVSGLNCLRLMNETTALALAYGIYKTDLPETEPVYVAFLDFSHSSFQVSIAALRKGQLEVLAHAWDRNLGGRDFDEALFQHFADEFQEKHKLDVRTSPKASFRLRLACEKLKKILSANPEAPLSVECMMEDLDFSSSTTRDKFEELSASLIERAKVPIMQAVEASKLTVEQISSVELVGGSSRVPAVLRVFKDFFGKEPSRTLNAKEAVSRGCALQCAMLSPIFRVREFSVIDACPYGVQVSWDKDGETTTTVLFEKNSAVPSAKMLTFFRSEPFTITASYTEDSPLPEGFNRNIGTFSIGPINVPEGQERAKIKVKLRMNLHCVVSVESVQALEEEEVEEPAPAAAPGAEAAGEAPKADVPMAEAEAAPAAEDDAEGKRDSAASEPMETEKPAADAAGDAAAGGEAPKVVKKKRTRKTNVDYKFACAEPNAQQLQELFEAECELALQAKVQEETSERKNAVEEYVYRLRNKLYDQLSPYVAEADKEALLKLLDDTENWLYDEGEDQPKSVYVAKMEELTSLGGPIEMRYQEEQTRDAAAASLTSTCKSFEAAAESSDPKLAHITVEERQQVKDECAKAMAWLQEKQALQAAAKKSEDPVLLTADIKKKEEVVQRVAQPILSKPAPAPKPVPKPAEAEPAAEAKENGGDAANAGEGAPMEEDKPADAAAGVDADTAAAAGAEPMEEEKSSA